MSVEDKLLLSEIESKYKHTYKNVRNQTNDNTGDPVEQEHEQVVSRSADILPCSR